MEKQLLYDRLEVSTSGLQISASPVLGSLADARCLCQPVTLSASLFTSNLADPSLPALRAKASLGALRIALDPIGLDALKHALPHAGPSGTRHHNKPVTFPTGVRIYIVLLHLLNQKQPEQASNGVWPQEKKHMSNSWYILYDSALLGALEVYWSALQLLALCICVIATLSESLQCNPDNSSPLSVIIKVLFCNSLGSTLKKGRLEQLIVKPCNCAEMQRTHRLAWVNLGFRV